MLRQRVLAALLGLPMLFLLLWCNWFVRQHVSIGSDDLLLLLIVLVIVSISGWEVSQIVRHRFSEAAPWNGVYAALIVPFIIHAIRPDIAGQIVPPVSGFGLLIDSVGATTAVMLLFLGVWSDVERRGREGILENLYVVPAGFYLGITSSFLLLLGETHLHEMAVVYLFVVVFALDTAAYFGGKYIGGARIAPAISPNKTWAGSIIGFLGACLFSVIFLLAPGLHIEKIIPWWGLLLIGGGIGVAGQIGDLLESAFKRWGGVKDSGQALPGHGGFLDRFDSFFLAAPVCYLLMLIFLAVH